MGAGHFYSAVGAGDTLVGAVSVITTCGAPTPIDPSKFYSRSEQPRILVVDDDEKARTISKAVLTFNQFRVTTALKSAEAFHLIDTETYDVLLSDFYLPGAQEPISRTHGVTKA
jgi:hypothetical protein